MTRAQAFRNVSLFLILASSIFTPSTSLSQAGNGTQRCGYATHFEPVSSYHGRIFSDQQPMTAERFAESIAQIRERAAAGALLLEPDDVNYLGSLSEAFYVENDVDFLQVESRRAFINQAGRFRVGFVLNQLDMSRDDARALVRYALSSQGACIDPTFRFELETFIAEDLRARLVSIPASTEGSAYVDFSLALSEAGRVINNELWNMTPELLEGYALTPSEFNQVYEGVGGRVAFLLGTSYLTPEQTDTLLKHPAIISSEAYRVRMHMLKTPNEPIRQNSR